MYPEVKQKGFAIVSAIFLIVVLAFLGVSMARILTSGQQAINQDISSLQAYYAGRSALQWSMYQSILADAGTITLTNNDKYTLTFSNAGLNNTTAEIEFNINTVLGNNFYNISAMADFGTAGNPEFSRRNVEIRFVP
ncbi:MAG: hypothetical protein OQK75_03455 [Gammaproteobacteria bacterium]|nr:hypothetical protein [Gammaproteobacteria bacterium]MCW8986705.1 hypothetical protein [Gammaproteobacteria bacterium]MCW9032507.1 hypothetical protein [Gammaproteobacteria bacterium]